VKIRVQFTPELTAALLCAGGWLILWLFAFRPAPLHPAIPSPHPEVTRLVTDDETLRKLKTPTLFALPSDDGFSGRFPEDDGFSGRFLDNQVNLNLTLEKTNSPARYLSPEKSAAPGVDRSLLMTKTALPKSELTAPGTSPRPAIRPVAGTRLFLSPELKLRTEDPQQLNVVSSGLPETIRVHLAVRSDGTVEYAFLETPVTNTALLSAVRQLQFKPARGKTEGWMDIRFTQEEK
jgi:hypothetical protein